jgi:hypothetical protein
MSTAITVYDNVQEPLAFVERFGTMIAKSRMFGCENEAQGQVLAMACLAERQNPIAIKRTYHIIDGNLSMRSDAMLAELRNRGGKHKVLKRTEDEASIEVTFNGETLVESLTWAEAQNEAWPYAKDGKTLKKNWRTPRARRQMLWARVVSEAVRTIAPEVIAGVYTPEEVGDYDDQAEAARGPVNVDQLMRETAAKAGEPIDAEYTVVDEQPQQTQPESTVQEPEPAAEASGDGCSPEQRARLRSLFDAIGATDDQISKALAKRGVKSIRELSADQAAEIITTLEAKVADAAESQAGESRLPEDARSSDVTGPVGQVTIDQIKSLMKDEYEIAVRVKDHLRANGKAKLAELSHADGAALLDCLTNKTMELFFARSLDRAPF